MSSHNQNEQVQYVYHYYLSLIFDQITMAQEQKHLWYPIIPREVSFKHGGAWS